jgi:hypothetical protein
VILNAHHIVGRQCHPLRFDLLNGICLCQHCHKYSLEGPHLGMLVFHDWLKRERPDVCDYLLSHRHGDAGMVESETQMQIIVGELEEALDAMP